MARHREKMPEKVSGGFSALPHSVFDSVSHAGASDKAKALLLALVRQLNGKNNGHLQLTTKWLKRFGYTCPQNNINACKELIERGLIVQTKFGGLNMGANLYAVTWLPISNFSNLDITINGFRQGAYALCQLPPTKRREVKKSKHFSECNSTVSMVVKDKQSTVTVSETENALLDHNAITVIENNVSIPYTVRKNRQAAVKSRIVGVKGKSGVIA